VHPVEEITIAGNLRQMFADIAAIGADAYAMGAKSVGSVLIRRMKLAGVLSADEGFHWAIAQDLEGSSALPRRVKHLESLPRCPRCGAHASRVFLVPSNFRSSSMERRSFVHGAGLAGVLAAGTAPAIVHAQANIRWRLTLQLPQGRWTRIFGVADDLRQEGHATLSGGNVRRSPRHAAGDIGAIPGTDGRASGNGTVEMAQHRALLLLRQGPDLRAGLRHPLRPERAPA
jgi:hypothetical protein